MHRRCGFVDRLGHRLDGGVGLAEQSMADTGHARQVGQLPVHPNQAVHPCRDVSTWRQVRNLRSTFGDDLVRLGLDLRSPAPHKRAADQQEDHQAEDRGHHNEQQPSDRRGRSTIVRDRTQRHDLDGQFDEVQDQRGPRNCVHRYHLSDLAYHDRAPAGRWPHLRWVMFPFAEEMRVGSAVQLRLVRRTGRRTRSIVSPG